MAQKDGSGKWSVFRLMSALLVMGYIVTSRPGQVTGGNKGGGSSGGGSPGGSSGASKGSSGSSSSSPKSSGGGGGNTTTTGSVNSDFEAQVSKDRYNADKILMASGRNDVNYSSVASRIQGYETANNLAATSQAPQNLNDLVKAEQERLAQKFPGEGGYVPTEESAKNIRNNLLTTGSPTSPMNRNPVKQETYDSYTGPRPGPGDPLGIKAAMQADATYVERNKADAVNYPAAWGGGQFPLKQQEAVNKGYTGYMKTEFGGGMGGQLKPESAIQVGFDKLFAKVAQRAEESRTGQKMEKHVFDVSGKISDQDIGKIPEGLAVHVPEGYEMVAGSFKFNESNQSYEWMDREVLVQKTAAQARAEDAQRMKDLGVYERQDALHQAGVDIQAKIPSGEMLKANMGLDIPAGYELAELSMGQMKVGFGGKIEQDFTYKIKEIQPDMKDIDEAIAFELPRFESKIPLLKDIVNPVYEYGTSEYRSVEYNRRLELLKATTATQKNEINAKYDQEVKDLSDPTKWKITPDTGMRYGSGTFRILKNAGYSDFSASVWSMADEVTQRFKAGDIPLVDIKPSPAGNAVVTGAMLGLSAAGGAAAGKTILAKVVYGAAGVAKLGVAANVQNAVYEKTGNVGLSFMAGGGAYAVSDAAVNLMKAKALPYNRDVQVQSNTAKVTAEFKNGMQNVATTVAKDIYVGEGRNPYIVALKGQGSGIGTKVGGELPVWVSAKNILGEQKLIPTYGGKTIFTTRSIGLGQGLAGETFMRKAIPAEVAFKGVPEGMGVPVDYNAGWVKLGEGLEVPAKAGYKLPGEKIGGRQPVAQQDAISTAWAGEGMNQKGVVGVYRVLTGEKLTSGAKIRGTPAEVSGPLRLDVIDKGGLEVNGLPKNAAGKELGSSVKAFKSVGTGSVSEFGERVTQAMVKKVRLDVGKTTKFSEMGHERVMASGTERVSMEIGGQKISKHVPLYTEVFKKLESARDYGLKVIKDSGGGSSNKVIDMGPATGSRSSSVEIPSMGQKMKAVLKSESKSRAESSMASGFSSGTRAEAALKVMNAPSYRMAAGAMPQMRSSPRNAPARAMREMASSSGLMSQVMSSAHLQEFAQGASQLMKESSMSALMEKQDTAVLQRQGSAGMMKQSNLQKNLMKQSNQMKQDLTQRQTVVQDSSLKQAQRQDMKQIQRSMLRNIPGMGGGGGFFGGGGGGGGFLGGGADKKSGNIAGFKFTVKNPWKNFEQFAEGVLGGKRRKR
jgi:hypothetical protein